MPRLCRAALQQLRIQMDPSESNWEPKICQAACSGNLATVRAELEKSQDILDVVGVKWGTSPLAEAAFSGQVKCVNELFAYAERSGIVLDVNRHDNSGFSIIHRCAKQRAGTKKPAACAVGHLYILAILLSRGAAIDNRLKLELGDPNKKLACPIFLRFVEDEGGFELLKKTLTTRLRKRLYFMQNIFNQHLPTGGFELARLLLQTILEAWVHGTDEGLPREQQLMSRYKFSLRAVPKLDAGNSLQFSDIDLSFHRCMLKPVETSTGRLKRLSKAPAVASPLRSNKGPMLSRPRRLASAGSASSSSAGASSSAADSTAAEAAPVMAPQAVAALVMANQPVAAPVMATPLVTAAPTGGTSTGPAGLSTLQARLSALEALLGLPQSGVLPPLERIENIELAAVGEQRPVGEGLPARIQTLELFCAA